MDPSLIPLFTKPIEDGLADYTKGNRFFELEMLRSMPFIRLFGNAALSFMTKFSTGYWNLFDPTNGYTAISANIASQIPFHKISHRYFFESDMLFRLGLVRAVVIDVPMAAKYEDEVSNLKIKNIMGEFFIKHWRNFFKRIFYNYYLRDLNLASFELPLGIISFIFGVGVGTRAWIASNLTHDAASSGTVMLAALPILMGLQLILAFIGYDISATPSRPVSSLFFRATNSLNNADGKKEGGIN